MGIRVAELKTPGYHGDTLGFAVYQSTSEACFTPIFHNQLAAELYSIALHDIFPLWDDTNETILAGQVNSLIHGLFGEKPEDHEQYDEYLAEFDLQKELLAQLRELRKALAAVKP